jgi:hypothetical protein
MVNNKDKKTIVKTRKIELVNRLIANPYSINFTGKTQISIAKIADSREKAVVISNKYAVSEIAKSQLPLLFPKAISSISVATT